MWCIYPADFIYFTDFCLLLTRPGAPYSQKCLREALHRQSVQRATSNAIFALKHRTGSLPVREGLAPYMARVDRYLISGEELAFDTDAPLIQDLQDVQRAYCRRLSGLNPGPHSMLAAPFTVTGQIHVHI
ncbi:hypothetical protein B0H12DRAFT_1232025 [Mycena haematopus]|nr:hypothetical protein B0H12DRAFT_1232025 [Mycena haematopus]